MKFNDKGPEVRALQQALISKGYNLPQYGADGHLGSETWDALQDYSKDHRGLQWDPAVPSVVVDSVLQDVQVTTDITRHPPISDRILDAVPHYDFRATRPNPPPPVRGKMKVAIGRTGKVVSRPPHVVTGIVVHQTAVRYGITSRMIQAAGGNRDLALARRAQDVACHALAFHNGTFATPNPLDWHVWHANSLNRSCLGLEIDGRFAGLMDDPSTAAREDLRTTWGGEPNELDEDLLMASCAALKWLVDEGRAQGQPIEWIYAHRQSSANRRSDPGEEIWRRLVLDYAVPVLGLKTDPKAVFGDGRPVPLKWDDLGEGPY